MEFNILWNGLHSSMYELGLPGLHPALFLQVVPSDHQSVACWVFLSHHFCLWAQTVGQQVTGQSCRAYSALIYTHYLKSTLPMLLPLCREAVYHACLDTREAESWSDPKGLTVIARCWVPEDSLVTSLTLGDLEKGLHHIAASWTVPSQPEASRGRGSSKQEASKFSPKE